MSTLDDKIYKNEETVVAISQENLRKTDKTLLFCDNQFQFMIWWKAKEEMICLRSFTFRMCENDI